MQSCSLDMQFGLAGVEVSIHDGHTLYDVEQLIETNGGSPPTSMTQMEHLVKKAGEPKAPAADPPQKLPPLPSTSTSKEAGVPSLKELGYEGTGTTPYKVISSGVHRQMTDFNVACHPPSTQLEEVPCTAGGQGD